MTALDKRPDMPIRFMTFRFYGSAYAKSYNFKALVRALIREGRRHTLCPVRALYRSAHFPMKTPYLDPFHHAPFSDFSLAKAGFFSTLMRA
jgi:hypothetical protein